MTTDNRTNEPTDEQVEAAAEGMWDRYGDRGMFQHAAEHMRSAFRKDARAALVAAAGEAPQAEGVPLHPDEREPIAINPLLRGVDLALDRLIRRDCFTERTLRVIDELREELTGKEKNE